MEANFKGKLSVSTETRRENPIVSLNFGENGVRAIPAYIPGLDGTHTIGIEYKSNTEVHAGETFIANCMTVSPDKVLEHLTVGMVFEFTELVGPYVTCEVLEIFDGTSNI